MPRTLREDFDTVWDLGYISKTVPDTIRKNLNPRFELREYQEQAIMRFIYYLEDYPKRVEPTQLLFHMATGSGKTLIMAAAILYLFEKGYRKRL
jgi:type III restriction enzyme